MGPMTATHNSSIRNSNSSSSASQNRSAVTDAIAEAAASSATATASAAAAERNLLITNSRTAGDTGVPDELLMEAIAKDKSEVALEQLHARHKAVLRGVIARVIYNDADVDDTLQDVFIQVWNRADTYSPEKGKVAGWLIVLARRRALDRLRQSYAYGKACDRFEINGKAETATTFNHYSSDKAEGSDLQDLFVNLMSKLPPAQEQMLRMAYFEGKSQRQIAATLSLPLGTVKTRVELGMKKLSKAVLPLKGKIV